MMRKHQISRQSKNKTCASSSEHSTGHLSGVAPDRLSARDLITMDGSTESGSSIWFSSSLDFASIQRRSWEHWSSERKGVALRSQFYSLVILRQDKVFSLYTLSVLLGENNNSCNYLTQTKTSDFTPTEIKTHTPMKPSIGGCNKTCARSES